MNYQDFARAVYDELKPGESFEEWDSHTFYSTEPLPPERTFCERHFLKGKSDNPYLLKNEEYILVQLSCTSGVWEIFTSDQGGMSVVQYATESAAREAWTKLIGK